MFYPISENEVVYWRGGVVNMKCVLGIKRQWKDLFCISVIANTMYLVLDT